MIFDTIRLGYTLCETDWVVHEKAPLFNRVYYVVDGVATLELAGETIPLRKSCVYIFPCMQPYRITQNVNAPLEVLWGHVYTKEFLLVDLLEIPVEIDSTSHHFIEILKCFASNSLHEDEFKRLFGSWFKFLSVEQHFADRHPSDHYIKAISDYIDEHLKDGIQVQDISGYLNIDRSYFSRNFKARYNISPAAYLHSKRLHKASLLLLQGYSITKTTQLTGYLDEKSFSRAFKQYMELSPAAYKRKYRAQP